MALSGTIVVLLVVAAVVAVVARKLAIPYSIALVIAGLLLGLSGTLHPPVLTRELLFAVFLPGLIFEAAVELDADEFWRNRFTILSLALPGVVLATPIVAAGLVFSLAPADIAISWGAAFVFATLIAATDPIAVVSLVRALGAPTRLGVLIESESLLNDGTAAVAFMTTVAFVLGSHPSLFEAAVRFVYAIAAAIGLGVAVGLATRRLVAWLDDARVIITITAVTAYGSFIVAESIGASGVIAVVTAGLLVGDEPSRRAMAPAARQALHTFWDYVAFALNSIVFLLIGFQAGIGSLLRSWLPILVAFVVVTVARIIATYAVVAVGPRSERLPKTWTAVLAWSGLRGSLAMVLALSLPPEMPQRDLVVVMTIGVVVLSILVQGLTAGPLLRRLRVTEEEASPAQVGDNSSP
jgi:CPA1 family monovalent cation:H+ antiporter